MRAGSCGRPSPSSRRSAPWRWRSTGGARWFERLSAVEARMGGDWAGFAMRWWTIPTPHASLVAEEAPQAGASSHPAARLSAALSDAASLLADSSLTAPSTDLLHLVERIQALVRQVRAQLALLERYPVVAEIGLPELAQGLARIRALKQVEAGLDTFTMRTDLGGDFELRDGDLEPLGGTIALHDRLV